MQTASSYSYEHSWQVRSPSLYFFSYHARFILLAPSHGILRIYGRQRLGDAEQVILSVCVVIADDIGKVFIRHGVGFDVRFNSTLTRRRIEEFTKNDHDLLKQVVRDMMTHVLHHPEGSFECCVSQRDDEEDTADSVAHQLFKCLRGVLPIDIIMHHIVPRMFADWICPVMKKKCADVFRSEEVPAVWMHADRMASVKKYHHLHDRHVAFVCSAVMPASACKREPGSRPEPATS
jgi:hypothetical protein